MRRRFGGARPPPLLVTARLPRQAPFPPGCLPPKQGAFLARLPAARARCLFRSPRCVCSSDRACCAHLRQSSKGRVRACRTCSSNPGYCARVAWHRPACSSLLGSCALALMRRPSNCRPTPPCASDASQRVAATCRFLLHQMAFRGRSRQEGRQAKLADRRSVPCARKTPHLESAQRSLLPRCVWVPSGPPRCKLERTVRAVASLVRRGWGTRVAIVTSDDEALGCVQPVGHEGCYRHVLEGCRRHEREGCRRHVR